MSAPVTLFGGDQPNWLVLTSPKWRAIDPSAQSDQPCRQPTGKRQGGRTKVSKRLEYIPHQAGNAGYFREAAHAR